MKDITFNKEYLLPRTPYSYTIEAFQSSAEENKNEAQNTADDDDDYAMYHQYYMGGIPAKPKPKKEKDEPKNNSFLIFVDSSQEVSIFIKKFCLSSYEVEIKKVDITSKKTDKFSCFISQKNLENILK